jgi:hypothetical protein
METDNGARSEDIAMQIKCKTFDNPARSKIFLVMVYKFKAIASKEDLKGTNWLGKFHSLWFD